MGSARLQLGTVTRGPLRGCLGLSSLEAETLRQLFAAAGVTWLVAHWLNHRWGYRKAPVYNWRIMYIMLNIRSGPNPAAPAPQAGS